MIDREYLRKLCDNFKQEHNVKTVALLVKRKEMAELDKLCEGWEDVAVLPISDRSEDRHKDGQIHFCRPPEDDDEDDSNLFEDEEIEAAEAAEAN